MSPIKRVVTKQLGELLLDRGIISKDQLDKAILAQKEKGGLIGQVLVGLGFVTEEQIAQSLTVQYGFPFLPLASYDIDPEAIKLIPENVAKQYGLIAVDKISSTLTVSMSNPLNVQAVEDIEVLTNMKVQVFVSTMSDIDNAIKKYYKK